MALFLKDPRKKQERWFIIGVVNCICIHDRAILWTDSAQLDDGGVLAVIAPNCLDLERQMLVLAAPRITNFLLSWRNRLSELGVSLDQLIVDGEALLVDQLSSHQEAAHLNQVFWHIGWSVSLQSPRILEFTPLAETGSRVRSVRSVVSQPIGEDDRASLQFVINSAASPEEVDMADFGRALLEAQRRTLGPPDASGRRSFQVGGYITQTEISRSGIRHDLIHHWPDRVGMQIDPFGFNAAL